MAYLEIKIGTATTMAPLDDFAASLGRAPENTVIVNDPDVSRRHCIIERYEKGYRVHDLGSRNGTKLNGQRVAREPLKHDDVIVIGGAEIKFVDVQPKRAPVRVLMRSRAAMLGLTLLVMAVAGVLVAWGGGWLGDSLDTDALRAKLGMGGGDGMVGNSDANVEPAIEDGTSEESDEAADQSNAKAIVQEVTTQPVLNVPVVPSVSVTPPVTAVPVVPLPDQSGDGWINVYELLTADTLDPMARKDLMRPVRAVFLGKPLKGDDNRLFWDLPPSGELIALIEPGNAAYDALLAEPVMVEAECCGVLQRRLGGSGLFLMVGEMRIIRAWVGSDDQLQPATRELLGKRIVVNPIFTAEKVQAPE